MKGSSSPNTKTLKDDVRIYEHAFLGSPEDGMLRPGGLKMTELAISRSGLPEGSRILDIGCGTGRTVNWLNEHGFSASGIDLSVKLLGEAKKQVRGMDLFQAAAGSLPFQEQFFDCVLMECSLSAVARVTDCLKEVHRVLHKNGLFMIMDLFSREPSRLPDFKKVLPESCLARSFIKEDLLKLMRRNGFDVILWEDHSEVLKEKTGQLPLSEFICDAIGNLDEMDIFLAVMKIKPGYFLCVSQLKK
jgi:SAM-dependent methyltransferase